MVSSGSSVLHQGATQRFASSVLQRAVAAVSRFRIATIAPVPHRLAFVVGIFLVGTFVVPRGANEADGIVMAWNLVSRVPATWLTTVFPLIAGIALLVIGLRRVQASGGVTAIVIVTGAVPLLVQAGRRLTRLEFYPTITDLIASIHVLAWVICAAICLDWLLDAGLIGGSQLVRRLFLTCAALLAFEFFVPSHYSSLSRWSTQIGLLHPLRQWIDDWGESGDVRRTLLVLVQGCRVLVLLIGVDIFRRRTPARWCLAVVSAGLMLEAIVVQMVDVVTVMAGHENGWTFLNRLLLGGLIFVETTALTTGIWRLARLAPIGVHAPAVSSAPRPDTTAASAESRLAELRHLLDRGLLSEEEYERKRTEIIANL